MSVLLAERQTLWESGEKMSAEREGELNVYLTDRGDEERIRNPEINEDVKQPLIRLSLQTGNFTLASVSSLCVCVTNLCARWLCVSSGRLYSWISSHSSPPYRWTDHLLYKPLYAAQNCHTQTQFYFKINMKHISNPYCSCNVMYFQVKQDIGIVKSGHWAVEWTYTYTYTYTVRYLDSEQKLLWQRTHWWTFEGSSDEAELSVQWRTLQINMISALWDTDALYTECECVCGTDWRCRACLTGNSFPQELHLNSLSSVLPLWWRLWRCSANTSSLGKLLSHSRHG